MRGWSKALAVLGTAVGVPVFFTSTYTSVDAQYSTKGSPSTGNVLVANEKLGDPNFAQTVILIVQFDSEGGTVGLVINRQSEIPVSRIFPKAKRATKDPIYMGGPVGITGLQALLRLSEKTNHATRVVGDVYVSGAKELIEKSIASSADSSKLRLYLGYAGWAPGQLEGEIRVGAWSVISGSSRIVFDPDPDSLWSRLNHDSRTQIASAALFLTRKTLRR